MLLQSHNFIHLLVELGGNDPDFLCSFVYGPAVWREKVAFWHDLHTLNHGENMPWVCMRDFNDILSQGEKQGGRVTLVSFSRGLSHFIQSMGFVDLGYVGSKFTWCNKCPGLANIRERLDRGISNLPWRLAFPNAVIYHHPVTNSDHTPLDMSLFGLEERAPKSF